MKTKFAFALIFAFLSSIKNDSHCQFMETTENNERVFIVLKKGKEIGWLKAIIARNGNETYIRTESSFIIDIIFSFDARATTTNKFLGSVLTEASVQRTLNGRKKLDNELKFINGKYSVIRGEAPATIKRVIRTTVNSLYFEEPIEAAEIFSEVYLCFLPITRAAESTYTYYLPDGGIMTYKYILGKLVNIVANTSYATLEFKLAK